MEDILRTFVPDYAPWVLLAGGILFAMVNAAVEEGAYRGVLMHALETVYGANGVPLVFQALAFGTLHLHGFPRGWLGVVLAALYGLMMGALRWRGGGMFAPWLAHVFTDVTIVCILVFLGRG